MTQVTIPVPAQAAASTSQGAAPGTPEYNAAMIALFEGQGAPASQAAQAPAAAPQGDQKPADQPTAQGGQAAQTPPENPQGDQKPADQKPGESEQKPDDQKPDETPKPKTLGDYLATPYTEFVGQDGQVKAEVREDLKTRFGITDEQIDAHFAAMKLADEQSARFTEMEKRLAELERERRTAVLHTYAGGQAQFEELIAWGNANLTPQERTFLNDQLNGPFAQQAIELLKFKRGATVQADPQIHTPTTGASGAQGGFRSQAEYLAAISDPRYETDHAYRQQVYSRLAVSDF
ncbi:hypothetical protein IS481_12040 [Caldimonas thermodepolymerans]|uniref:Uncharacterized protein n=1 Tax=Caldimonas thermodepolymerans TaxID=215580 RepID=A0A2S5T917_9BURK|nr:hypothetical protein [Caldimonas thermodepolymerans]PPE71473.1 hypothetical protein C1702_00265 [Caldimonas thermodepolymerans]QPC30500.1 hypothetical protein IS481_12040 [Caldimonas thermodepolymerans]RDI02914.1 hypothetical protein DES46_102342 [Caldimonas thermodepolymerans]